MDATNTFEFSGKALRRWKLTFAALVFCGAWVCSTRAVDLDSARKQFISGQYTNCIAQCEQAIADREYEEEWRALLVKSQFAVGPYGQAGITRSNALDRYSWSAP